MDAVEEGGGGGGARARRRLPGLGSSPASLALVATPHVALATTTRCQHRCVFCFEGERGARRDLPVDRVEALLDQAKGRVPAAIFMGAEPTAHPRFVALVEAAASRGFEVAVSTNLRRFADQGFARRCVDAGLRALEGSFHYPDAEAYARLTRRPARGFDRVLGALETLEGLASEAADAGRPGLFVLANLVLLRDNVDRLDEVLGHLASRAKTALRGVALKRLSTRALSGAETAAAEHAPEGDRLRGALVRLLGGWPADGPTPLLRDLPLCAAPGWEARHADLVYHGRRVEVLHNFGLEERLRPMFDLDAEPPPPPAACLPCSLAGLCGLVTRGLAAAACPGLRPLPSTLDPGELLADCGLEAHEVEALLARSEAGSRPRESAGRGVAAEPQPAHAPPVDAPTVEPASEVAAPLRPEDEPSAPGRGAAPAGAAERLGAAVRRCLARLEPRLGPTTLEGLSVDVARSGPPTIRVALHHGDGPLRLVVEPRVAGAPCFAEGPLFAISHTVETPVDTPARTALTLALLELLEGLLAPHGGPSPRARVRAGRSQRGTRRRRRC